jgi:carboxyl-terminal processing protease
MQNIHKKIFILLSLVFLAITVQAKEQVIDINKDTMTRLEALQKLTKVIGTVEKYYVDDIKLNEIVNKALKGLMQELDAHSTYMDEKYFKEMKIQTAGEFGGLGIVVGMRDGALTVISPIDDTPAFKAGIKSEDIILKIDNKSTLNMTLDEAVGLMRGKPNTKISLTIVRKKELKPLKIDIIRDIIKVKSVNSKIVEDEKVLYLRVASFDKNVTQSLKKIILENKDIKGIILDLRNNPGGLLNQAIGVVDLFVNKGVIVSQKGRAQEEEKHFASKANTITDLPVVVLVNGGSASASEIVSGALQDFKRAVIIGQKTFGKGSVQVVLPITKDQTEGIKLTIAKYYLPSGRTIQAKGITPDIIAYPGEAAHKPKDDFSIKEADLKKHLEVELNKADGKKIEKSKKDQKIKNKKIIKKEDLEKDNQLNTALNVLKALILIK